MPSRNAHHRLHKLRDGIVAIDQGMEKGFYLSYNPDDERYYVCENDDGVNPRASFKRFANAVQWARNWWRNQNLQ